MDFEDTSKFSQKINSFFDVKLKHNYLLVLDIDETIIKYDGICKKWWEDKYEYYFEIYKDHDLADQQCVIDWKEHIKTKLPSHTDEIGFLDLLQRAKQLNCEVIMVTARDEQIKEITFEHLQYLNITDIDVHFVAGGNKGLKIEDVTSKPIDDYDGFAFVDDMDYNHRDVKRHFRNKVICYKFDMEHDC